MSSTRSLRLLLPALLSAACAAPAHEEKGAARALRDAPQSATLEPATCGSIQRLHTLDGLYLASQPSPSDLAQAKVDGVKTVVNLRHERELAEFDERALVEELGLRYVALPWSGPAELTDEVFTRARELLRGAERPLLLHCASANRVGAVWVPYRVLDGGISLAEALAEAHAIGLKTPELEAKARDYVARHASGG